MSTTSHTSPTFVEVVVPLALPKSLTYKWFSSHNEVPMGGARVVVPLGHKKWTGVIWEVHQTPPEGYVAKEVEAVVDDAPVLTTSQRDMFSWMATHYMCSLGEMVGAALPSGMKLESTTRIVLHPDAENVSEAGLDEQSMMLLDALHVRDDMGIRDCAELLGIKHPQRAIRTLLQRGLALAKEELNERVKPKMVSWVRVADDVAEEELSAALAWAGVKAVAMERLLLTVIEEEELPKVQAQKRSRTDASTVQKWVDRGILVVEEREPARPSKPGTARMPVLSDAQAKAYNEIHAGLVERKPVLLHGVTGSGKTEIYTHLIAEVLAAGQQVLFLVPEIALTTQLIERLRRFFGDVVHVYHSRFSDRERTETWMTVLNPKGGQLIVGARSAVLLPLSKLGLVVVDEEHEPSFKQHAPAPRYHARDVALWMAVRQRVPLVLGSATRGGNPVAGATRPNPSRPSDRTVWGRHAS